MPEKFEALFVDAFAGESSDVIVELKVAREILVVGGQIPISFTRRIPCDTCKGTGRVENAPLCEKCEGKGGIRKELTDDGKTSVFFSTCEACDGRGHPAEHSCKECERGLVKKDASLEVAVPAGSASGMQIRVPKQGHIRADKPPGDVVVVLASGLVVDEGKSVAASKLPSFIAFVIVTILVLVLTMMMVR